MSPITKKSTKPNHVAIILDGNRRWAKLRNLPSNIGHYRGLYHALWPTVEEASRQDIRFLTVFGFSTENWNRKHKELDYLLKLFEKGIRDKLQMLHENNICFKAIGQLERFPKSLQGMITEAVELTKHNSGLTLTFALSYGGRQEILQATRKLAQKPLKEVTETTFAASLYDAELPDVDLLIRTSGEKRLSGFLLWQVAYAELYFTDTLWPDFGPADLILALKDFAGRQRRYGT